MCVTPCSLIYVEVSMEGPEYIFDVEGGQKLTSVKKERLKRKLSILMFLIIRVARMTSYLVPTDVQSKLSR